METYPVPWEFSRADVVKEISRFVPVLMIHPVPARHGYLELIRLLPRGSSLQKLSLGRFQLDARLLLPGGRFPLVRRWNQRAIAAYARRAMRRTGIERGVLWFAQPEWWRLAEMFAGQLLSLYDCNDNYTAFPDLDDDARSTVMAQERHLMTTRGVALAVSLPLVHRLRDLGGVREVTHVAHGARTPASAENGLLDGYKRPIIGLVGRLNDRYDYDLVEAVSDRFSDCTVLLAGTVDAGTAATDRINRLSARANVSLTGELTRSQAVAVAMGVDVGLIPYVDLEMNRFCDPVKMYDHLAGGVPVVASPVARAVVDEPLVRLGSSTAEFLAGVQTSLATPLDPDALRAWRAANSNEARARKVLELVLRHAA